MPHTSKLFMAVLGCRPGGRLIEQHDVFFGVADAMAGLVPQIKASWPDAGKIHIDSWREVTAVSGFSIEIKTEPANGELQLYFINMGGYKPDDPDEYHHKILVVAPSMSDAVKQAKQTHFYKNAGFAGAVSHIDDKFGIEVDELYRVDQILHGNPKHLHITPNALATADVLHIGYLPLTKLRNV